MIPLPKVAIKRAILIGIILIASYLILGTLGLLKGPLSPPSRLALYTGTNFARSVHIIAYASDHSSKDSTFGWNLAHNGDVLPALLQAFNKGDEEGRKFAVSIAEKTLRFGPL